MCSEIADLQQCESTISIQEQPLTESLIEEGRALLSKNWIRSGSFKVDRDLNPDFARYLALAKADRLVVVTLRHGSRLVGYGVFAVGPSMHHKHLLVGHGDAFYVERAYRDKAALLYQTAEELLRKRGVCAIGWCVVKGTRAYHFMHQQGFKDDEIVMEKMLCASSPTLG